MSWAGTSHQYGQATVKCEMFMNNFPIKDIVLGNIALKDEVLKNQKEIINMMQLI